MKQGMNARQIASTIRTNRGPIKGIRSGTTYECVGGPLCGQFVDLDDNMVCLSLTPYGWGKSGHTISYCLQDNGIARYREIKLAPGYENK